MHTGRFGVRIACMNSHHRMSLLIVISATLAACASPAGSTSEPPDPPSQAPALASSQPGPSTAPATTSANPTPHDMGGMDGGETVTVDIANFAFEPAELVIAPGTEVVFTNSDSAPHTVTAGTDDEPMPEVFDSGLLEQGDTFSSVFEEPGEFAYFCDRHPPMTATVVVEG